MLFRKKIERACAYCKHGVALCDDQILCVKKGVRTPDSSCRRFQYDPSSAFRPNPRPWISAGTTRTIFPCKGE